MPQNPLYPRTRVPLLIVSQANWTAARFLSIRSKRAMSYADKTITCRDCGTDFVFTTGEQEFYAQKGFTNEPTRCPSCRQQRKGAASRERGGYGDRGYSSGAREMHSATCASCGREAM